MTAAYVTIALYVLNQADKHNLKEYYNNGDLCYPRHRMAASSAFAVVEMGMEGSPCSGA